MSINGKHWYRYDYLKSEEWRDFRNEVLAALGTKCRGCKSESAHNDVHHIWYGEGSLTGLKQFAVLCRECHKIIHGKLEPVRAVTEKDRADASLRFSQLINSIAKRIENAVIINRPHCCSFCGEDTKPVRLFDLVRQVEPNRVGHFPSLCDSCIATLKHHFKPLEKGNSAFWEKLKTFLKDRKMQLRLPNKNNLTA